MLYLKLSVFVMLFLTGWAASADHARRHEIARMNQPLRDEYARVYGHRPDPAPPEPVLIAAAPLR